MQYRNRKFRNCPAMTLLEIVISLAIITIIFAAVLPQFRVILKGWDSRQANAEVIQNGRILIDHICRNLSKAVKITDISESLDDDGYIEFLDNDNNSWRYDVNAATDYVEFGITGSLSDLAGPVGSLTFTCYDACDLDNPLSPVADVNIIRAVRVDANIPGSPGGDKIFSAWVYLRTNDESSECDSNLVGWWKLDETSGGVAEDSSDSACDGTVNGNPAWQTDGPSGTGYLDFDGTGDYVDIDCLAQSDFLLPVYTISMWFRVDGGAGTNRDLLSATSDSAGDNHGILIELTNSNVLRFLHRHPFSGGGGENIYTTDTYDVSSDWHHLAAVRESDTSMLLYVDGVEAASSSTATTAFDAPIKVFLGTLRPSAPRDWNGGIDDVRIYNRALTPEEVADLAATVTYSNYTSAKVDTDDTSIVIPTPGSISDVSLLGSWASSGEPHTHTAEAGSNRLLILTAHVEDGGADMSLNSVTYGGQSMTKVIEEETQESSNRAYVVAYVLDEAGIDAAADNTFTPSWSSTPDRVAYSSVFLANVEQTDPIGASDSAGSNTAGTLATDAVATNDGDMVIVAGTAGNTGNYSVNYGFTEAVELAMTSSDGIAGYKLADGSDETPSITHNNPQRQVIIGFVVQEREGGVEGIEGDLLIAAVATDGDTSSSLQPVVISDWNEIDVGDYGGEVTLGAWYRFADASESDSHEFTWSGGQEAYGWIMHFTGHNPDEPINDYSIDGQTSITPTSPEVITSVNNCLILRLGAFDNGNITVGNPGLTTPVVHAAITMDKSSTTAVTFVAAGNVANGTEAITPALPAGIASGDILLLCLETANQAISIDDDGGGTWAEVDNSPQGTGTVGGTTSTRLTVFWSRYNGTQGDPTTSDSGNHQIGRILAFRGVVSSGDPWDVTAGDVAASASTSVSVPGAATTVANTLVVAIVANATDTTTAQTSNWANADLTSLTEQTDNSTRNGNGGGLGVATGVMATAGAYDDTTATLATSSVQGRLSIALMSPSTAVSGGAGYVMQGSAGDSGNSNFALTASDEAQMITIAIAPVQTEEECSGGLFP